MTDIELEVEETSNYWKVRPHVFLREGEPRTWIYLPKQIFPRKPEAPVISFN